MFFSFLTVLHFNFPCSVQVMRIHPKSRSHRPWGDSQRSSRSNRPSRDSQRSHRPQRSQRPRLQLKLRPLRLPTLPPLTPQPLKHLRKTSFWVHLCAWNRSKCNLIGWASIVFGLWCSVVWYQASLGHSTGLRLSGFWTVCNGLDSTCNCAAFLARSLLKKL